MTSFKSMALTLGLALNAVLLPAISSAQTNPSKAVTFVSANPSALVLFPVYIAQAKGYFADEGIDLRIESVDGSGPSIQALQAGRADIIIPGVGPALAARERGVDVVFFYNYFVKSSFGLHVKDESPYKSPEDLGGKVIGTGTADGGEVAFGRAVFEEFGMKPNVDYTFLTVGDGGPATAGFLRGDIDAYVNGVADIVVMNARGLKTREITPDRYKALFGNGFASTSEYIDANPEVIEGFGRALARGMEFAVDEANKEEMYDILAAVSPQEIADRKIAEQRLVATRDRTVPFDDSNGWGYYPPDLWEMWQKLALGAGMIKQPVPDISVTYTNRFVSSFNTAR